MKKNEVDYRLYAVTDGRCHPGISVVDASRAALRGGATVLQMREKHLDFDSMLAEARELAALCRSFNACFIVNDDVEVAAACGADGVHIGQEDGSPEAARARLGADRIVGVSVQTLAQAVAAEAAGADYLGVGAMFPTPTKTDAVVVPFDELRAITRTVKIPVVVIGGVKPGNLHLFYGCGIAGAAIVSAIFAAPDIEGAARECLDRLSRI